MAGPIIPIVRVKITKDGLLPKNANEFNSLEYVQTAVTVTKIGSCPLMAANPWKRRSGRDLQSTTWQMISAF